MAKTNLKLIERILDYCLEIEDANRMFNYSKEEFINNKVYRNAVSMCLLQIDELSKQLSYEYEQLTSSQIPWKEIRGLRNIVAHEYAKIDANSLWETIEIDIPKLKSFCQSQIQVMEQLNQLGKEVEWDYEQ